MKNIPIILIVILCFSMPANAQWTSFELDNVDPEQFEQQVEPFLKAVSLSINRHVFIPTNVNKRMSIGVSYSQGFNITEENNSSELIGGYPNISGAIIVTQNLSLKGNFSIFESGNDIVQSFAYGFGLNITNEKNNNWRLSALFSKLQGPDDLKNRSIEAAIIKEFEIGSVPIFAGAGLNTYNTRILIEDLDLHSKRIKGSANHILLGAQLSKGRIYIVPVLQVNFDVIIFSIEMAGVFK